MTIGRSVQPRKLTFIGNSYLYRNGAVLGGFRIAHQVYASAVAAGKKRSLQCYAVGGKQTQQLISEWSTIDSQCKFSRGDVVVFWEIINDLAAGGQNATQAYNNVVTFCNLVRATGAKVAVMTMIAADLTGTYPSIDTNRQTVNTNIRNNYTSHADVLIDPASLSQFDALADTANASIYDADLTHLTNTGEDLIVTNIYNGISSIL